MTLTTTTHTVSYAGNDVAVTFAIPFKFFDPTYLVVVLTDLAAVDHTLTINGQYTVSGGTDDTDGTLTMVVAPPTGTTLTITRVVPLTQELDLPSPGGTFDSKSVESEFDRIIAALQQIGETGVTEAAVQAMVDAAVANAVIPVFDVAQYGAGPVSDGSGDASPYFILTEAARKAANGRLTYRGTYRLDNPVVCTGNYIDWEALGIGSTLIANKGTTPELVFGDTAAQTQYLMLRGIRIKAGVAGHRVPMLQIGARSGFATSRISVNRVQLDFNFLARDGVAFYDVFNGQSDWIEGVNGQNAGPVVTHNATTQNSGNMHFSTVLGRDNPILMLLNEYDRDVGTASLLNSDHLNTTKCVRGSNMPANKFYAGTVAAGGAAAAATAINVTAGQGANYIAGDWIVVCNNTGDLWIDKLASVVTDALHLTASAGLPFALAAGAPVVAGYWHAAIGAPTRGIIQTVPHDERANGIIAVGARGIKRVMPVNGVDVYRSMYLLHDCIDCTVDEPFAASNWGSGGVVLHQSAGTANARNRVRGPCAMLSAGQPTAIIQADAGELSFVNRCGGTDQEIGPWKQDTTVADSQTDVQLTGPDGSATIGYTARKAGYLYGVRVHLTSPRTAGTLTVKVFKNGTVVATITAVVDGTITNNAVTEKQLETEFIALAKNDELDIRVTTASWTPTANNLRAWLQIAQ